MQHKDLNSAYLAYFNKLFQLWENTLSNTVFRYSDGDMFKNSSKRISDHNLEFGKYMTDVMNKSMIKCSKGADCMQEKKASKANYLHHNYKTFSGKNPNK